MKSDTRHPMIEIDALRVGMFVHLDLGWMAHPFPLGSFKITDDSQIATIRSLGVRSLRWSPTQSDALDAGDTDARHAGAPTGADAGATAPATSASAGLGPASGGAATPSGHVPASTRGGAATGAGRATAGAAPTGPAGVAALAALRAVPAKPSAAAFAALPATPRAAELAALTERRLRLAEERVALQHCERQFAEAAAACRQVADLVALKPDQASAAASQLSQALVDKMIGAPELCIRLLHEAAGDKASLHALNVTVISLLMGRTLGFGEEDLLDLGVGALLHDVGKLDLPDNVRHRADHFSGAELRYYQEHVALGVAQARRMALSPGATLVIAQHHEHADGRGFPLHLNVDRMTAAARVVALVNRYDNLCNPQRPGITLTPHEALSLLFAQGQHQFDTAVLGSFIRMMGVYPAGSTVQLTDDRYALVVGVNSTRPLKPRVRVHDPAHAGSEAAVVDLESVPGLGIRRSLKPAQLPAAALDALAPRARIHYFFETVETAAPARETADAC